MNELQRHTVSVFGKRQGWYGGNAPGDMACDWERRQSVDESKRETRSKTVQE